VDQPDDFYPVGIAYGDADDGFAPVGLAFDTGLGPPNFAHRECYGNGRCSGFIGDFSCDSGYGFCSIKSVSFIICMLTLLLISFLYFCVELCIL
jgi:hypothetical protein